MRLAFEHLPLCPFQSLFTLDSGGVAEMNIVGMGQSVLFPLRHQEPPAQLRPHPRVPLFYRLFLCVDSCVGLRSELKHVLVTIVPAIHRKYGGRIHTHILAWQQEALAGSIELFKRNKWMEKTKSLSVP